MKNKTYFYEINIHNNEYYELSLFLRRYGLTSDDKRVICISSDGYVWLGSTEISI